MMAGRSGLICTYKKGRGDGHTYVAHCSKQLHRRRDAPVLMQQKCRGTAIEPMGFIIHMENPLFPMTLDFFNCIV